MVVELWLLWLLQLLQRHLRQPSHLLQLAG